MYDFKFADIGEGIHEGQILKWFFKVGDQVKEGETLCVIETDKVNAEIPSPVDGILKKRGAEEGEVINVGNTLALLDTGDGGEEPVDPIEEKIILAEEHKPSSGVVGEITESDEVIAAAVEAPVQQATSHKLATPLARKVASDLNIDINKINGTGENGRVLRDDILNYQKPAAASAPVVQNVEMPKFDQNQTRRVPITRTRKAIVKAMVTSKSIVPHTVLMDEVNVTALVNFRKEQKELAQSQGAKLTYLAFIIKALTLTMRDFPIFNSSFDHNAEEIIYKNYINMGIAVDTPDGLTVPNIKDADKKSIFELAKEVDNLATAAREKKLQLSQIQGGTFTITNYGSFDATFGSPIINYPEVAIMGIGKILKKPVVVNDEIVIGDVLPISLAVDHRIIDGADAGRFSIKFKEYLTNPMLLLLS